MKEESTITTQREILVQTTPTATDGIRSPCTPSSIISQHFQVAFRVYINTRVFARMEQYACLTKMNTVITDRIRGTGSHTGHLMAVERARVSMFIQVLIQFGKSSLLTRINTGGMITITDTKLIIENKRSAGTKRLPLFFDRHSSFMLCPMTKVLCREMFKVMSSATKFTLMSTTIVQVEKMIGHDKG